MSLSGFNLNPAALRLVIFEVPFSGHKNILSTHKKTIEITKEKRLTPQGDCIVGVGAEYACTDIPDEMKRRIRDPNHAIRVSIVVGGHRFEITGRGHERLTLKHAGDIVVRKSGFVCSRTLAVRCDRASDDIPREMIRQLQDPEARGVFSIEA